MLKVARENRGAAVVVRLSGSVDDGDDLNVLLGQIPAGSVINCKGVTRVNSVGVKNWIKYFSKVTVKFEELSPVFVEQLNSLQNFCGSGEVVSVVVPYLCEGCNENLRATLSVAALKKSGGQIAPVKCPKCGGNAVFDDVPEEYFAFILA